MLGVGPIFLGLATLLDTDVTNCDNNSLLLIYMRLIALQNKKKKIKNQN